MNQNDFIDTFGRGAIENVTSDIERTHSNKTERSATRDACQVSLIRIVGRKDF